MSQKEQQLEGFVGAHLCRASKRSPQRAIEPKTHTVFIFSHKKVRPDKTKIQIKPYKN